MGKEHGVQLGSAAAHVEPDHDLARRAINNMGPGGSGGVLGLSAIGTSLGLGSAEGHAQIQREAIGALAEQLGITRAAALASGAPILPKRVARKVGELAAGGN